MPMCPCLPCCPCDPCDPCGPDPPSSFAPPARPPERAPIVHVYVGCCWVLWCVGLTCLVDIIHSPGEASSCFAALLLESPLHRVAPCCTACVAWHRSVVRARGILSIDHRSSFVASRSSFVVRRSSFVVRRSWVTSSSPHHHLIITSASPHHLITSSSPHRHLMALKVRVRYRALDAAQIDARGGLRLQGRDRPRRARRARHSDERVRLQDPPDARDGHDARDARQELVQRGIEREVERSSPLQRASGKKHTHNRLRRHQEVHPRGTPKR